MIECLHIENVAVVKCLDIELKNGMIALTGETGAGKSIIIDSLNLLSGSRADKELLRSGENKAEVSAVFSQLRPQVKANIEELGFEVSDDGKIMLSRTVTANGSSARINGKPITLSILKEVSSMLFGIHGQNENMMLLEPKNHIRILDGYSDNGIALAEYAKLYSDILHLRIELHSLSKDVMEQNRMREMLKYQIDDIDAVKLRTGEEEELEAQALKLRSAEKINKCCALVEKALNGGKGIGAIYLADRASAAMDSISDALPEAQALARRLSEVKYELEDISQSVGALFDEGENSTARLDKIESRLDAISKLKRKYGSTVEEIIQFRNEAIQKLELLENAEDRKIDLESKLLQATKEAKEKAGKLSEVRRKAAKELEKKVCQTLDFLDMPKVAFQVDVKLTDELNAFGADEVEFLISANVGEPLLPMARIASGGELSRIMLSLKNVVNESDGIDTVIFDEIDAGISGKTARKVGIKLKEIGREAQVICVTHSAQISSLASQHLYVSKLEKEGRTESTIKELSADERVMEIARILGGINITDAQTVAAREMISDGEKY